MVFCGYHSLMSELRSKHPLSSIWRCKLRSIYSLELLLHLRHLERQLATHCNTHKHGLHHIVVHGFIVWMLCDHLTKMPWLFQKARLIWMQADVDSQEKAFISMSSTPPARASWEHLQSFTMELNSYLGMSNLLEKKGYPKMVGTWQCLNCGTLTEVQKRKWWLA